MNRAYSRLTIKSADAETGVIAGVASTPEVDRHGDVVEPEGAKFNLPVPLLFSHDHNQPIGAVTEARVTQAGIEIVAKLALEAGDRVREAWELIRAGALRGLSVGFRALEREPLPNGGYRFTSWDLLEISAVAVPANAEATITNVKHFAALPVTALRVHPVKARAEKGTQPMATSISTRTASFERIADGALVPWISRAKALGWHQTGNIEMLAQEAGAPRDLAAKLKAAVAASTTDDAPGLGGQSAAVTSFVSQVSEQSVLARIFAERWASRVPLNTRLMAIGLEATAAVVGGAKAIPVAGLPWDDPVIVEPVKIAAALVLTKELWSDVSPAGQSFVNSQLRAAIATACDRFLFDKLAGATPDQVVTVTADAPDVGQLRTAMKAALDAVHTRAAGRLVWAVSPQAANALSMATLGGGSVETLNPLNGNILGIPAVISSGFDGDARLGLIDAAAIGGDVRHLEITATDDATVEMDDAPAGASDVPTPGGGMVSLFQTNSVAVKYVLHLGLEPIRDNAGTFITLTEAP